MGSLLSVDNSFVHRYLERNRFLYRYNYVFDHLKGYLFNLRDMDVSLHRVRYGLLNRDRDFFDDGNDDCFRYGHLNRDRMRYRNKDWLVDFELYVLVYRDDYFFVMLDGLRVFLFNVLVDRVGMGLEFVTAEVLTA